MAGRMEGDTAEVGVGVSDAAILTISILGFAVLAYTIYSILITRLKTSAELDKDEEDETLDYEERLARSDVSTLNRAQRRARAKYLMKQQRKATVTTSGGDGGEEMEEEDSALMEDSHNRHLSRKERQKAAKAAEREERKLFEQERRDHQRQLQEAAQREKKERERLEADQAEKERLIRQEKKCALEQAEYEEWKMFLTSETKSISVREWIEEVKNSPTRSVHVDELANTYMIPSYKIVERIRHLLDSGRISGALATDGRFVYISEEELRSIAKLIMENGKMSVQEVAQASSSIIRAQA